MVDVSKVTMSSKYPDLDCCVVVCVRGSANHKQTASTKLGSPPAYEQLLQLSSSTVIEEGKCLGLSVDATDLFSFTLCHAPTITNGHEDL